MFYGQKDLLGLREIPREAIQAVLDEAKTMLQFLQDKKSGKNFAHDFMSGKVLATLFYENSTRTRVSFELAAKYAGGITTEIQADTSSVTKGESLIDTAKVLEADGVDFIALRHPMSGAPELIAKSVSCHVINAGDGCAEHPTQALLDMFTVMQHKNRIEGLKVAIVGDILHSRVARSNIWGFTKLGAQVSVGAPLTLIPPEMRRMGVSVYGTVHEAVIDADVIITLRIQSERIKESLFPSTGEYARFFGINKVRLKLAKPDCMLLHPMPFNRGVELSSEAIQDQRCHVYEQVTNGVAVRMALLKLLMN